MFVSAGLEAASREDLLALIAALTEANAVLAKRVAELEKKTNRNSGNSNMPPSTDVFGRAKDERAQAGGAGAKKEGPRRGKRTGAKGRGLSLVADPDVIEDVFPPACGGCAAAFADLEGAHSPGYARRQCTDIPPTSAQVTETRWHTVACGCGAVTAAEVSAAVPDAPCYGPGLAALAVYLLVHQHVPVARTAELINDLTGAQVSTGWVAAQLPRAAGIVAGSLRLIKALLALGHVLHADETTTNIAGTRRYLHEAGTERLTYLQLGPRSRAAVNAIKILPVFRGTLIHDAYFQLYDGYPHARHQLCVAHVTRELTAQEQLYPEQRWAARIRWIFSQLIKHAAAARAEGLRHIPPERIAGLLRGYDKAVADGIDLHPRTSTGGKQSDATNLLERLCERIDQYLLFAFDLHVPATNNLAERDQRPVKTQLKISGCHQSEAGARNWLAVRSYISSARKNAVTAYDAIRQAMAGDPWTPTIALTH